MKKSNCTGYGRSALLVYMQFSKDKPVSIGEVCQNLGKRISTLVLDNRIDLFIMGAADNGFLSVSPDGYTLTEEGYLEREKLKQICKGSM